jgi:hypothetical protein
MQTITVEEQDFGLKVRTSAWTVAHHRSAGGAWGSVIFHQGSGKNLLRRPFSSAVRFVKPDPKSESGIYFAYEEAHEKQPRLRWESLSDGGIAVVAEGTYQDVDGKTVPLGFRRRTEYREHGLVYTTLDLMSDTGCDGVVEVRAMDLPLRPGLTDCYVRFHPTQAGGADLLGGRAWFDLARGAGTHFLSRYTPMQIICFERGGEGIEVFPGSDLAQWDCGIKPDLGLGLYMVTQDADGTTVEMNPYCLAFRRMPVKLQGTITYKLGIGLPAIKPRRKTHNTVFHATVNSRWPSREDIARVAHSGVKLIRLHNDYREDGPFWHDGAYPPYDELNMRELRRVIDTVHEHGMKIIPYVSLKELHPDTPAYKQHAREWMHMAAPSLDIVHTWVGSGEFGGLMCMNSGWLDFRKRSVDTILSDLPWDGLYFDWTSFHPCCHPKHARGPYHSDVDQFLEFMFYCRQRVGKTGTLMLHMSGVPSIVAENLADIIYVLEDQMGILPMPGQFPPQCDFMSIAPRMLVATASPGPDARRLLMAAHLQGHPPATSLLAQGFDEESLNEIALFAGIELAQFEMHRASEHPVETQHKTVHAATWTRDDTVLLYLCNFSMTEAAGKAVLSAASAIFPGGQLRWEQRRNGEKHTTAAGTIDARDLSGAGVAYRLPPWGSSLLVFKKQN